MTPHAIFCIDLGTETFAVAEETDPFSDAGSNQTDWFLVSLEFFRTEVDPSHVSIRDALFLIRQLVWEVEFRLDG